MIDLIQETSRADAAMHEKILDAALQRYAELFPDWEILTLSLHKHKDRNEQLDQIIKVFEHLKD